MVRGPRIGEVRPPDAPGDTDHPPGHWFGVSPGLGIPHAGPVSRSVVLAGTERCDGCQLPPRWCVCHALPPVESPVRVHVLQHRREQWRPSSTGSLVGRVVTGSRITIFHRSLTRDGVQGLPDPTAGAAWILHPRGEPLDGIVAPAGTPPTPTVLLIDGSWTESGRMLQFVQGWGRPVRLTLNARSRYRLRNQKDDGNLSTAEALIGLYEALGLAKAADLLRWHLELRVYVGLRSRGRKAEAEDYLAQSPIRTRLGPFLDRLHARRPNLATLPDVGRDPEAVDERPPIPQMTKDDGGPETMGSGERHWGWIPRGPGPGTRPTPPTTSPAG